jgi:hypothetical protein
MADTHEEQLLNELLRELAQQDTALDGGHLEARVVEQTKPAPAVVKANMTYLAIAAVVLMAIAAPITIMFTQTEVAAPATLAPVVRLPDRPGPGRQPARDVDSTSQMSPPDEPDIRSKPYTVAERPRSSAAKPNRSSAAELEFVPLTPFASRDLTGPFQIMRVQMPRGALGRLSPLESPHELIEADVLLGEDGMARAIRISTGTPNSPWRPQ